MFTVGFLDVIHFAISISLCVELLFFMLESDQLVSGMNDFWIRRKKDFLLYFLLSGYTRDAVQ